jgi:hypothetical protein
MIPYVVSQLSADDRPVLMVPGYGHTILAGATLADDESSSQYPPGNGRLRRLLV